MINTAGANREVEVRVIMEGDAKARRKAMNLTSEDQLTLVNFFNKLENPEIERFAQWKIEPDGALVFINDGPTTGNFSREKTEAEIQIGGSTLSHELKTRAINALVGFSGKQRVVGVAIRDQELIMELLMAIKEMSKHSKRHAST